MEYLIEVVLIIAIIGSMSAGAYFLGLMTPSGAAASFITGAVIGLFGSFEWFILLLVFTVAGFVATKMGMDRKKAQGLQEGSHGERTMKNVLGVALGPCIIAIINFFVGDEYGVIMSIAFISSIAVAAADTIGSEIGVRDSKVWMCTTLKRVPPGTDGGMSLLGTTTSLAGSAFVSALGWLLLYHELDWLILIPTLAGFIGMFLDSVLGATLETQGRISKYTNNASTGIMGAIIAAIIAWPFVM